MTEQYEVPGVTENLKRLHDYFAAGYLKARFSNASRRERRAWRAHYILAVYCVTDHEIGGFAAVLSLFDSRRLSNKFTEGVFEVEQALLAASCLDSFAEDLGHADYLLGPGSSSDPRLPVPPKDWKGELRMITANLFSTSTGKPAPNLEGLGLLEAIANGDIEYVMSPFLPHPSRPRTPSRQGGTVVVPLPRQFIDGGA